MSIEERMKDYENESKYYLETKKPVIIRIDGKSFSKYTKQFQKPFDNIISNTMKKTAIYLCKNIQNCKFAYTQSDEISLVLIDDENDNTDCWFANNIQKICSVSASIATAAFNSFLRENVLILLKEEKISNKRVEDILEYKTMAMFDSRAFNLPKDEIVNYLIWRQNDAIRNSIQMCGRSFFKHNELQNKNTEEIKDMLKTEYDFNWNNLHIKYQRGIFIKKIPMEHETPNNTLVIRKTWLAKEPPVFSKNKEYIEELLKNEG